MKFINNAPYSEIYDDFYFNFTDPLGEAEYVFINPTTKILETQDKILVAELGFGVGRNFLLLSQKFIKTDKKIHYVSIEKFPLNCEDLSKIYANIPSLKKESKRLIKRIGVLTDGIHRINYSKNITLDLCIGDAKEMLNELEFKADIWFLDGFSPAKNRDIWDDEIMQKISTLTKKNGTIATYTSSTNVSKALKNAGFDVHKTKGFNNKREMIQARLSEENNEIKNFYFARPLHKFDKTPKILVVGAGIAGLSTAFLLQKAGLNVVIAEKRHKVALNGSSNFSGVVEPLITQNGVTLGKMHISAFLEAFKFYKKYVFRKKPKLVNFCGAKEFAFDDELEKRYKNAENSELFSYVSSKPYPYIFIKNAALAMPSRICKFLSKKVEILYNHEVCDLCENGGEYEVKFSNQATMKFDIIIICAGSESEEFFLKGLKPKLNFDPYMQISSVRGQTTLIRPLIETSAPLSARGYICPPISNLQLIGATYDRYDYEKTARKFDDLRNLESVEEFLPKKAKIIASNVGFRGYSGDRFALIGPILNQEESIINLKSLPWIKNKASNLRPSYQNIYLNTAHGSRGLSTAILGAQIICDYILNRPFCATRTIIQAVHPGRFLIRKLKKGLVK